MSIKLQPYLNFNGTAAKAIAHYERTLGATVMTVMRYGEAPGADKSSPNADRVMHSVLRIEDDVVMMGDVMPEQPAVVGNNVQLCLNFDDVEQMRKRFAALAEGGKVTMALEDTFWGATFGMLTDAFGVPWMFNCEKKKS